MSNWILEQIQQYMPHRMCWANDPNLTAMSVMGDALHFLAYMAISGSLAFMCTRHWPREYADIKFCAGVFSAFVFTCGVTHILSIAVLWYPIYKVQIFWSNFSGAVSFMTMVLVAMNRESIMRSARLGRSKLFPNSKDYSDGLFNLDGTQRRKLNV